MIQYHPHQWFDHLFDVEGSMVREITGRVAACVVWAAAVVAFHRYARPVGVSPLGHTLVGLAIGLLLVFRTNASYDRFWEGRRQWGNLTNESRNLGRGAAVLLRDDPELLDEVLGWTAAFPYAVMDRLRGRPASWPASLGPPLAGFAGVASSAHPPLAVALRVSRALDRARASGRISDILYTTLDSGVQRLVDALGACERIHSTPLPFVYVVHLRRALIAYAYTLPFALLDAYGWSTVPATLLIAYMLFGIEEIGVEIEDPFGTDANDLPLELYCQRIETYLAGLRDVAPGAAVAADGTGHAG